MKIVVVGEGWIGKTVFSGLKNMKKSEISLLKTKHLNDLKNLKNITLINCSGIGHPSKYNEENEKREKLFITSLKNLAANNNWSIVHISSASVISYNESYPEREAICSKAPSRYAKLKCSIEKKLLQRQDLFEEIKIIRLFSLYGPNGKKQIIHDIYNKYNSGNHNYDLPSLSATRSFVSESQLVSAIKLILFDHSKEFEGKSIINLSAVEATEIVKLIEVSYRILNTIFQKDCSPTFRIKENKENPIINMHPKMLNNLSKDVEESFEENLVKIFKMRSRSGK